MTPAERLIMISDYFGKNEREIIFEICEENKKLRATLEQIIKKEWYDQVLIKEYAQAVLERLTTT